MVLPIGAIPTANPFGNVGLLNGTSISAVAPISSIVVPAGGYGSGETSNTGTKSSNNNHIIIPVAVIAGVLALGLLVALFLQKQRNSMERELRKPTMMSNKANLIAASSGALGFTSAGVFRRNRRGSDYGKSSHGHGIIGAGERESWHNDGPYREGSIDTTGYEGQHQIAEMTNAEIMAASGAVHRPESVLGGNDGSRSGHRQSLATGEGGYRTASEEGIAEHGSFFKHGQSQDGLDEEDGASSAANHYDGSASYGYSNPATKGLDAAGVEGSTGNNLLSPYPELQRGATANRASVAGTEVSSGQAYDGADLENESFNYSVDSQVRLNPHYDGNKVMQHPQLNSSRWSG